MINLRILKVTHSRKEYEKLLDHVKWSNVWSSEYAGYNEDLAVRTEKSWERVLKLKPARLEFEAMRSDLDSPSNHLEYSNGLNWYLCSGQVPLWISERLPDKEFKEVYRLKDVESDLRERSLVSLHSKDIEGYFKLTLRSLKVGERLDELRDKNIARNLDASEEMIRKRYKILRSIDPLNLGISLGGLHSPENYMRRAVEVIDLTSSCISLPDKLCREALNGIEKDRLKVPMLAAGISDLAHYGKIPTQPGIESMGFDQLAEIVEKF